MMVLHGRLPKLKSFNFGISSSCSTSLRLAKSFSVRKYVLTNYIYLNTYSIAVDSGVASIELDSHWLDDDNDDDDDKWWMIL